MKAVLFDMDYTLLDRERAIVTTAREQFRHFAASTTELDSFTHAFKDRDLRGFSDRREVYAHVANTFGLDLPLDELVAGFDAKAWSRVGLYDGVGELLLTLTGAGVQLGLVTNGSAVAQNAKIDAVGLRTMIDHVFIAGELNLWKPDPAIFLLACDAFEVPPTEVVFVGDSPDCDVIPAHALGMQTIWKRSHHAWPHDEDELFDEVVDCVEELTTALRRLLCGDGIMTMNA